MISTRRVLLSSTMMPLVVATGFAAGAVAIVNAVKPVPAMAQCGAAKCNPCNPCAAAKCNPCAASACSPCNPCNPCAAGSAAAKSACVVPRLQKAAKCNPCAAAKATPCNPCGAGSGGVELSDQEAVALYDCLMKELKAAYAKSNDAVALSYQSWPRYSTRAYVSATHGERHVQNYANAAGRAYGAYERAGEMPKGAILAKDSFTIDLDGRAAAGPLFIMEKMDDGWHAASDDWRYSMIMPNGSIFGTTKSVGDQKVQFCADCHMAVTPDVDSMMFIPEKYRVKR